MGDDKDLAGGPQDLGDRLERLLDRLSPAGLGASPRDRINATKLVAALIARGEVHEFRDWDGTVPTVTGAVNTQ